MKKLNRMLALVLALCMAVSVFPANVQAEAEGGSAVGGSIVSPLADRNQALAENAPQQSTNSDAATGITVEKLDKLEGVEDLASQLQVQPSEELTLTGDQTVRVIVVLKSKSLLERGFTSQQINTNARAVSAANSIARQQDKVIDQVQKLVSQDYGTDATVNYQYSIALNGIAMEVPYGSLESISEISNVETAFVVPQYNVPEDMSEESELELYTYASSEYIGTSQVWETGYDGAGMLIAVIDTGLDIDHPSFAAAPENPALSLEDIQAVADKLNATAMSSSATPDRLYRSEKIPFAFNYVDRNLDVTHDNDSQGDHGTHVAGIAAANRTEGTEVVGVAPDAQLLIMKVFGSNGGANFDDILAALEDCYVLGVDAVNLSLGTPAGYSSTSDYIDEIFSRIIDSGMILSVAAGNSSSAALLNGWGTNVNLTSDPDNGIISSPSTYVGSTSVASMESPSIRFNYVQLQNGEKIPYNDIAVNAFTGLYWNTPDHLAEYVMIPGVGAIEDYEGISPTLDEYGERVYGISIAVVARGSIDFVAKQTYAASAGFDAIIVYDNIEEDLINMADGGTIPNVFVTMESGAKMAAAADENGHGELYLKDSDDTMTVASPYAGLMSDFSSWGVTPDLQLQPEVTAPGGYIYSTLDNGHYGTMSGTSMAAPHFAGMSVLVMQYLQEYYPELTDEQRHTVTEALLISTAEPVLEGSGLPYSPRKQGSGLANVMDAITSEVYLTANNGTEQTPKVSFGDDDSKLGVYHFSFQLNNLSDEAKTYRLDGIAMTDQYIEVEGYEFMTETSHGLDATFTYAVAEKALPMSYDYNADGVVDLADVQALLDAVNGLSEVKRGFDLTGDRKTDTADAQKLYELIREAAEPVETVEVPANGTATVLVTLTLSDGDKAYMDAHYCNGIYVDGFVRCYAESEDGVDLSLPFLGFYGDWSQAPVFDSGWYSDAEPVVNRYINVLFTDYGSSSYNLGLNPYLIEDHDAAHNVLSPNGDGYIDTVNDIYLGMMRNGKQVTYSWLNEAGETLFDTSVVNTLKSYYMSAYGFALPLVYSWYNVPYYFTDDSGYVVEDLDRVTLKIEAWLDDGDSIADETVTVPVVIDTQAPVLDMSSIRYIYDAETDSRAIELTVSDNYDIAAVVALTRGGGVYDALAVTTKEAGVDGETATLTLDVSDYDSTFQIAVCDYGCNESYYEINFSGAENYAADTFYAYRLLAQITSGEYIYLTEGYNGWHSFSNPETMLMHTSMFAEDETYTYAAEYVDGYIIAVDANNTVYAMELGEWDRTDIGKLEAEIDMGFYSMTAEFPALDIAFDYTTDTLFVLTDESMYLGPNTGGHLLALDWLTGECTHIGTVTGLTGNHQALTLACDNDGILYTVDAVTGDLYTLDKSTATASFVGETGYVPLYQQSMAVDHDTNKLYWAAYQDITGTSTFFEVDKTTGELLSAEVMEYNSQLSGLFKPYSSGRDLIPDGTAPQALTVREGKQTLRSGDQVSLHCLPVPYYAELDAAELVWTTSDSAVATVSGGTVTAVGVGECIITATLGDLHATCAVEVVRLDGELYVFDFGTDTSASNTWLELDVNDPAGATYLSDVLAMPNGITAAAYANGSIYAYDSMGSLYRLDPETLDGDVICTGNGTQIPTAMAFNYADGYMYALIFDGGSNFDLCQVNLYTGETRSVMSSMQYYYGTPIGGMAIDPDGRFYLMSVDSADNVRLDSFVLAFDGWGYYPDAWYGTAMNSLDCYSFSSMVWSEANNGLFWANDMGELYWLGIEITTELTAAPVNLGTVGKTLSATTGMAMNMGLVEIPEAEPELPDVALTGAAMSTSFTVPVGGSVDTDLSVEPWNGRFTVTYAVADSAIATVDENGALTGVSAGETTLTATVYNADGTEYTTLTATVTAINAASDLYMFLITDYVVGGDCWLRLDGANPADHTTVASYDFTVYAAGYYNGYIYAVASAGEEYGYKNHLMRINGTSFAVEEIYPVELSFDIRDMAFDYTTGTMYGIAQGGTVNGAVCQFDLTTGEAIIVADSGVEIAAMSCDAEGQLYAITADGNLNKLNKHTAELTVLGRIGSVQSGYQGMHYDHDSGNTYWVGSYINLVDTANCSKTALAYTNGAAGSLLSMPLNEPAVPQSVDVSGVVLPEKAAMFLGESYQLSATVLPVSVSTVDQAVTWTSSDESVATVDANGLVTAVTSGTVTVTASAGGYSDSCTLTVLAEAQKFYAYNESDTCWVQINTETGELTTVLDETDVAPIMSAVSIGDSIYAFDDDGYFYSIDPETFQRTKLGDGLYGNTTQYASDGFSYYPTDADVTNLSYDPDTGRLYGTVHGLYFEDGLYLVYSAIVEVNLEQGRENPYTTLEMDVGDLIFIAVYDGSNGIYRPGNLLVMNGYAYSVDTWFSGILSRVELTVDESTDTVTAGAMERLAHTTQLSWGQFYYSRSLVYDPVFDTVYTLHDLGLENGVPRSAVTLCTMDLGNASSHVICELGRGIVINSLIIR